MSKNRMRVRHRLTLQKVDEIRALWRAGWTIRHLAKSFKITQKDAKLICYGGKYDAPRD